MNNFKEKPLFLIQYPTFSLLSRTLDNIESSCKGQLNLLKDLSLYNPPLSKYIVFYEFASLKVLFEAFYNEIVPFATDFFCGNNKISPLINLFSIILNESPDTLTLKLQNIEGDPISQIVLFLQYYLNNSIPQALHQAFTLLKNYGLFPLYEGHLPKLTGLSLILFLLEAPNELEGIKEKLKEDLLLGEPFLLYVFGLLEGTDRFLGLNPLIESLKRKKTSFKNAWFLLADFFYVYYKGNQVKQALEGSIELFQHEIAQFRYYNLYIKEFQSVLDYFPLNYIKKWLFPSFLNAISEKSLIEGNIKEAFRYYCLNYLLGDYTDLGTLFSLCYKARSYEFCNHIASKMKELKIEGFLIKEVKALIKIDENLKALELLKENILLLEKYDLKEASKRYLLINGCFYLGRLTKEFGFYRLALFIILINPAKIDLFGMEILRKILKEPDFKLINKRKKALIKIKSLLKKIKPEISLEFAIRIGKTALNSDSKGDLEIYQRTSRLLGVTIESLKGEIMDIIQYQSKIQRLNPFEIPLYSDLFVKLAEKVLFPYLEVERKGFERNLEGVLLKNKENFLLYGNLVSFNVNKLFNFINTFRILAQKPGNPLIPDSKRLSMKVFPDFTKEDLIINDKEPNSFIIKETGVKAKLLEGFLKEESIEFIDFQKKSLGFYPFNLIIYGSYNEDNGYLIESSIFSLDDFISQKLHISLPKNEFLCILTEIISLNVSCNLSGFHGLFLYKPLLMLITGYKLKLLPFPFIISQNYLKTLEIYDLWVPPELFLENSSNYSKIDSWVLGMMLFRYVFNREYWDVLQVYYNNEEDYKQPDEKLFLNDLFHIKKNLLFNQKARIPLEFIENLQNNETILDKNKEYPKNKTFSMSPELRSEMLSESIMSLSNSPLKSFKKEKSVDNIIETPVKNTKKSNIALDKRSLNLFLLNLIEKCLDLNPENRPSPLEMLFELHKHLRTQQALIKGVFQFIPEALLLQDLPNHYNDLLTKEFPLVLGTEVILDKKQGALCLKTKKFNSFLCNKNLGRFTSNETGVIFEGEMSGFIPQEGVLDHLSLGTSKYPMKFEENSMIPDKKTRIEMGFNIERKGKDIEELIDFQSISKAILLHKKKPFLIDLYNNHYISDYNNEGTPLFFYNPIDKTSQPLLLLNWDLIVSFKRDKLLIYDPLNMALIKIQGGLTDKITFLEVLKLIKAGMFLEVFSLNGLKFAGNCYNNSFLGVLQYDSIKIEFLQKSPDDLNEDINSLFCKILYPNGDSYEGAILEGRYTGIGRYYYKKSFTFIGNFLNDLFREGTILYHNSKDIIKYEGQVLYESPTKSYLKHGFGRLYYKNGDLYEGSFEKDLFQGQGVFYHNKSLFKGEFIKGVRQGKGFLLRSSSGDCKKRGFIKEASGKKEENSYKNFYEGKFHKDLLLLSKKKGKLDGNRIKEGKKLSLF